MPAKRQVNLLLCWNLQSTQQTDICTTAPFDQLAALTAHECTAVHKCAAVAAATGMLIPRLNRCNCPHLCIVSRSTVVFCAAPRWAGLTGAKLLPSRGLQARFLATATPWHTARQLLWYVMPSAPQTGLTSLRSQGSGQVAAVEMERQAASDSHRSCALRTASRMRTRAAATAAHTSCKNMYCCCKLITKHEAERAATGECQHAMRGTAGVSAGSLPPVQRNSPELSCAYALAHMRPARSTSKLAFLTKHA